MVNIIKSNLYKYSRNKHSYIILAIIAIGIWAEVLATIYLGSSKSIENITKLTVGLDGLVVINVFLIFATINIGTDCSNGVLKNIVGRGITREKYLIGNIITIVGVNIIIWIISSVVLTVNMGIFLDWKRADNPFDLFLKLVMSIIFLVALVTMLCVLTMIFKNGVIAIILVGLIYSVNFCIKISEQYFLKATFNIKYISIPHYIMSGRTNMNNTKLILLGICVGTGYIIVFMLLAKFMFKRQEVR